MVAETKMRKAMAVFLAGAVLLMFAPAEAVAGARLSKKHLDTFTIVEKATGRTIELEEGGADGALATMKFTDPAIGSMAAQVFPDGTVSTDTGLSVWTSVSEDILNGKRVRPQSITVVRSGPNFKTETFTVKLDPDGKLCPQEEANANDLAASVDPVAASFSETARLASFNPDLFFVSGARNAGVLGKAGAGWDFGRYMNCVGCGLGTVALVGAFVALTVCTLCWPTLMFLPVIGTSWAYECGQCVGG